MRVQEISGKDVHNMKARSLDCMARLLRSNIQDFVQEVPVGQRAQPWPPPLPRFQGVRRGKGGG